MDSLKPSDPISMDAFLRICESEQDNVRSEIEQQLTTPSFVVLFRGDFTTKLYAGVTEDSSKMASAIEEKEPAEVPWEEPRFGILKLPWKSNKKRLADDLAFNNASVLAMRGSLTVMMQPYGADHVLGEDSGVRRDDVEVERDGLVPRGPILYSVCFHQPSGSVSSAFYEVARDPITGSTYPVQVEGELLDYLNRHFGWVEEIV